VAQTSGTTVRLRQLKAVNDNVVWACGASGVVLRTINGGNTWEVKTPTNSAVTNYSIEALDSLTAWVTGTVGGSADFTIWKTTDGGMTWTAQYNNPAGFSDGIRFFNANEGVCYADPDPWPSTYWEILVTTNGGNTWTRVPASNIPPADSANGEYGAAGSIDVVGNTVWFSAYYNGSANPTKVYKSTDKGNTWTVSGFNQAQGFAGSSYVAFADANNGVAVCLDGTTAKTTDGGATWNVTPVTGAAFRYVVNVPGFNLYMAVGSTGTSWYSQDGVNWTALSTGTTQTLYGIDATANYAWACGNGGTILRFSGPPLPVELTSFTASLEKEGVQLVWTTASELNNHGFEIQRSANKSDFTTIGFVKGHGSTTQVQNYSFLDRSAFEGKYYYRLKQIDFNGLYNFSDVIEVDVRSIDNFALEQNYPNPFNSSTKISWQSPVGSYQVLKVLDILGSEIITLVNEYKEAGYHEVEFNSGSLASGVYFYQIQVGDFTDIKKMVLLK
ncbi:MAG: T9SS type A sorting domain-containing protein, partial [Ignavibacterium sp.]